LKSNIDLEEETFKLRKSALLEKINYYKFIIKNTNHEALTTNNSLIANQSLNKNPAKYLLTNFSEIDAEFNFNNSNKNENLKTLDFCDTKDINMINYVRIIY